MNIVVCVKQVPNTTQVRINPETNTLVRDGVESIMNPFDENALEMALQLKEKHPGTKVTALTMGPPQAAEILKEAVGRGADAVVLLCDQAFAGSDTWATSYALSMAIAKLDRSRIWCCSASRRSMATPRRSGRALPTGWGSRASPMRAALRSPMERPWWSGRSRMAMKSWKWLSPCALTVLKEANVPRMASLRGKMAAKKLAHRPDDGGGIRRRSRPSWGCRLRRLAWSRFSRRRPRRAA